MRNNYVSRLFAYATINTPVFVKQSIYKILGLGKKQFKFHSSIDRQNILYHQKTYIDMYNYDITSSETKEQQENRLLGKLYFVAAFITFFGLSDFLTSLSVNQSKAYYYYIRYPDLMKAYDQFVKLVIAFDQKYLFIFNVSEVNSEYGYNKYKEEVLERIFGRKARIKISDQKIIKLRSQLNNIDEYILAVQQKITQ